MTAVRRGRYDAAGGFIRSAARSGLLRWLGALVAGLALQTPQLWRIPETAPFAVGWFGSLLFFVALWKVWRNHLAPYLASGPMPRTDVERLSAAIEVSGEFIASDSTQGEELGGSSWARGYVEVVVHPAGLLLEPLHFPPQAVLAGDITRVERYLDGRTDRIVITHRATAARSPLTLRLDPGLPIPTALDEVVPRSVRAGLRPMRPRPMASLHDRLGLAGRVIRVLSSWLARPYVVWLYPYGPIAWLEKDRFPRLVVVYRVLACVNGTWSAFVAFPDQDRQFQAATGQPMGLLGAITAFVVLYVVSHAWALLERR